MAARGSVEPSWRWPQRRRWRRSTLNRSLDLGMLGAFDDSGVTSSSVVRSTATDSCFYTGWSRGVTRAVLSFRRPRHQRRRAVRRASPAPLLDRNCCRSYLTASPFVLRTAIDGGCGTSRRPNGDGKPRAAALLPHQIRRIGRRVHVAAQRTGLYRLRRKTSMHSPVRASSARTALPDVVRRSRRPVPYRATLSRPTGSAGLASRASTDWTPTGDGWESTMVEYPFVFRHHGRRYMLYNGNDYGRSGVGLAVWEGV